MMPSSFTVPKPTAPIAAAAELRSNTFRHTSPSTAATSLRQSSIGTMCGSITPAANAARRITRTDRFRRIQMTYHNVTVFGGGNAAFAVAACMSLKGKHVTLCDFPEFEQFIAPIRDAGEVDLIRQDGPMEGKAKIHGVTTNIAEAVKTADLILVCAQAYAHGRLAREAAPHLRDGQHVLLL